MKEKKVRVEDAMHANAVVEEAIVPGGDGAVVVGQSPRIETTKLRIQYRNRRVHRHDLCRYSRSAKVNRAALQNAASIAALMLTTEALISKIPEEEKAPALPGGAPSIY
jgi:chaperonin GroEL